MRVASLLLCIDEEGTRGETQTMNITKSAFVLAVPDCHATAEFLIANLGFETVWQLPGMWHTVANGSCEIRMGSCPDAQDPDTLGDHRYFAYLTLTDLEPVLPGLRAAGALLREPTDEPWGMREVPIKLPTGHRLMLAMKIGGEGEGVRALR